eukprot:Sdes_comp15425_c0_seq1m4319
MDAPQKHSQDSTSKIELEQKLNEFQIPKTLEEMLNLLLKENPKDYYGFMSNFLAFHSLPPTIEKILARQVIGSNGKPTLEVDIQCIYKGKLKLVSRFASPISSQYGPEDLQPLHDKKPGAEEADSPLTTVEAAVELINSMVDATFHGKELTDNFLLDKILFEEIDPSSDKHVLGINSIFAVSVALAMAAAHLREIEPFEYFAFLHRNDGLLPNQYCTPIPVVSVISGRGHCNGKIKVKEFMIFSKEVTSTRPTENPENGDPKAELSEISPKHTFRTNLFKCISVYHNIGKLLINKFGPSAGNTQSEGSFAYTMDNPEQAFEIIAEACTLAGLELGKDMFIAIDVGASQLYDEETGKYEIAAGQQKPIDDFLKLYEKWIGLYNGAIKMIEDPLSENDKPGWEKLKTKLTGKGVLLVGDHLYRSDKQIIESHMLSDEKNTITSASPPKGDAPDSSTEIIPAGAVAPPNPAPRYEAKNLPAEIAILKPNSIGTVSSAIHFSQFCNAHGIPIMVSSRSNDSPSDQSFLADFAVGVGAKYVKFGAPCRGERAIRYNRLLAIEEYLDFKKE